MTISTSQTLIEISTFPYLMAFVLLVVSSVTCEMPMKHLLPPDRLAYLKDYLSIARSCKDDYHHDKKCVIV